MRLSAALAVAALSLALAGTAQAAYDPTLLVGDTSPALGGRDGVRIFVQPRDSDDPTGMVTIYSPKGYGVKLDHTRGTAVGSAIAFIRTGLPGALWQAVQGPIRVADPAAHTSSSCAPGLHDAVWLYEFRLGERGYALPIYVDRAAGGPEAAHASARLRLCSESPSAPPPTLAVGYADITVEHVFTNPRERGTYAWNAVFVPYSPGRRR